MLRHVLRAGLLLTLLSAAAVFLAGTVLLQDTPMLTARPVPDGADVAATRTLVRDIRGAASQSDGLLQTNADQLNSALLLGSRFLPGFRGEVRTASTHITGLASIPVPWLTGQRWLNVTGQLPEFSGQLSLSKVTVADYSLPPRMALAMARIGTNLALGDGLGDTATQAAQSMQIKGETLTFRLHLSEMGKNGLMRGTFGTLRGDELPTPPEIEAYYVLIRTAMDDGRLSETGSFLPYLQFTLRAAQDGPTPASLKGRYTAAILGLAKACGAQDFSLIVGRLVFAPTEQQDWQASCADVTLNGRIDSRRHFLTSAALQAMSNTGFAVSAGEFKELYDTISGAGGFDFTDMAANLSGIRMSNTLMATPPEEWPTLLTRLSTERAVIIDFDGIPQIMFKADFNAQFGDIDSTRYRNVIAGIETRIDDLSLHRVD